MLQSGQTRAVAIMAEKRSPYFLRCQRPPSSYPKLRSAICRTLYDSRHTETRVQRLTQELARIIDAPANKFEAMGFSAVIDSR